MIRWRNKIIIYTGTMVSRLVKDKGRRKHIGQAYAPEGGHVEITYIHKKKNDI